MSMLLTDAERKRFIAYSLHEAQSLTGILEQMKKIKVPEAFINDYRIRIAAYTRVARDLMSVEVVSVNSADVKGDDKVS